MNRKREPSRFFMFGIGLLTLIIGMWAGLVRMGWVLPGLNGTIIATHGAIMVSGFMGTVICLERAVGMGDRWMYAAPAVTAVGAVLLLLGLPPVAGGLAVTLGSLGLIAIFVVILKHQPELHSWVMTLGAVLWFVGNLLWLSGWGIPQIVPFWAGFLILTIAGERLEMSRLLRPSRLSRILFGAIMALFVVGLGVFLIDVALGWRLIGVSLIALSLWLLKHDIARRTVRQPGLTRFIGSCMISGYVWLSVSGLIGLIYGFLYGGLYDAALHSIFLGFVIAMIFGHSTIILPSVLGLPVPYRRAFYAHLTLLHLSLIIRVAADLLGSTAGVQWGGVLNVTAVTLFLVNTVLAVRSARGQRGTFQV
ncbi:MAG: hypothetical protein ACM3XM_19120 [Mycobacterium leprae]